MRARIGEYDTLVQIDGGVALRFDVEGRWCSLREARVLYRRTVDGEVVSQAQSGAGSSRLRSQEAVHELARSLAREAVRSIRSGGVVGGPDLVQSAGSAARSEFLIERLAAVGGWSPARHAKERAHYREAYEEPIPVLPPDRYRDVVVAPALGCSRNTCSFCSLHRGTVFRTLSAREYSAHLTQVHRLFGRAIGLRTGVFLGSGNALVLSQDRLLDVIERTSSELGSFPNGLAAFWDPDSSPSRETADWARLHEVGLTRVYVGLETGLPHLRRALGKSDELGKFVERVRRARQAGPSVGLTVLAGPGGCRSAVAHRAATVEALRAMDLCPRDIVYVSPLAGSMPVAALKDEMGALTEAIGAALVAKVAPYRLDGFRYFA